ncbi:hypothetical protein IFR05_004235 [Cadophora sp. M221]|nr:hypothetical protein IFR05_004235 [Cadophora sp. M221]
MSPQTQAPSIAVPAGSVPSQVMAAIPAVPFYKLAYDVKRILWDLIHNDEHRVRSATATLTENPEPIKHDLSPKQYLNECILHLSPSNALETLYLVLDTRFNPNIPPPTNSRFVVGMTGILGTRGSALPATLPNKEDLDLRDKMLRAYQHASHIKSNIERRLVGRNSSATFWHPHRVREDDPGKPVFQIKVVQWSR